MLEETQPRWGLGTLLYSSEILTDLLRTELLRVILPLVLDDLKSLCV